jgi:hypothetical protein
MRRAFPLRERPEAPWRWQVGGNRPHVRMHRRCSRCDAADGAARRQQSGRLGGANNPDSSRRRAPDRARCWFAAAATIGKRETGIRLDNVSVLAEAFTAALGETFGRVVFAMGLSGGALVATINICLTAAWAIGEVTGVRHSLEHPPAVAPGFIWHLQLTLAAGDLVIASGINLVSLSIGVGVANALLFPIALGFVYRLACTELPELHG